MKNVCFKHISITLLLLFATGTSAAEPFPWEAFSRSSVAYFLLQGTPEGRALFERVTLLVPRPSSNLSMLRDGLEGAAYRESLKGEVETRLNRIRERFGASPELLSSADQRRLALLASEELNFTRAVSQGPIEFVREPVAAHPGYAAAAHAFRAPAPAPTELNPEELTHQWKDSISPRVREFQRLWSEHSALTNHGSKKVLAISRHGLGETQLEELRDEYLRAFSRNTVSFPIKENGTHLFVRIESEVLDFNHKMRSGPYLPGESEKTEPVVILTNEEWVRARAYAKAVLTDSREVIGPFGIEGATGGLTEGKLNQNRSIQRERHNCTSWICTAPIGGGGTSLLELVGASPALGVHTDPEKWLRFLTEKTTLERVPLVIFWSNEPLPEMLDKINQR